MPELSLSLAQASRLFGISQDTCAQLLSDLVARGLLHEKAGAKYGLGNGRP